MEKICEIWIDMHNFPLTKGIQKYRLQNVDHFDQGLIVLSVERNVFYNEFEVFLQSTNLSYYEIYQ